MAVSGKKEVYGGFASVNLRKPNLMQEDPKKGDYVKGKEEFLNQVSSGNSGFYILSEGETLDDAPDTAVVVIDPNGSADGDSGGNVDVTIDGETLVIAGNSTAIIENETLIL